MNAPVTLLRPSSEAEKQATFHGINGRFYTVGLRSGQSFVAKLPAWDEKNDPFATENFAFRLRPLNNLLPQLKEVVWIYSGTKGPQATTLCEVTPETTKQEKQLFECIFGEHKVKSSCFDKGFYQPHEMFVKLDKVDHQLCENARLQKALRDGQQQLRALMMLDNNSSMNQVIQDQINERRQKNG